MKNIWIISIILLMASCSTCNRQTPPNSESGPKPGEVTEIKLAKNLEFKTEDLTLEFVKVKDNRCPSEVNCVIAGEGQCTFVLSKNGQNQILVLIAKGLCQSDNGSCGQEKSALGYTLKLINLYPYPKTEAVEEKDYFAKIVINKGGSTENVR